MSCPFSSHEQQSRKKIKMEIYTNDDNMFGSHFSLSKTLIFDFPPFLHIPDFLLDIGYRGGGGGGQGALNTQQSFIWGDSTARSKPLPFYIPFLIE